MSYELTIFIPTADNDGVDFNRADFAEFEMLASQLFGGVTVRALAARGLWVEDDRLYADTHNEYIVMVSSIADFAKVIRLADFARDHFRQEAIYLRYLGQAEIWS
jgi:hypothetical protein